MTITSPSCRMPHPTPDPTPHHRDDLPAKYTWWVPTLRMSVAAGMVAATPHTSIQLPFTDRAWMLHTTTGLTFVVGTIGSLFLFAIRHKP